MMCTDKVSANSGIVALGKVSPHPAKIRTKTTIDDLIASVARMALWIELGLVNIIDCPVINRHRVTTYIAATINGRMRSRLFSTGLSKWHDQAI